MPPPHLHGKIESMDLSCFAFDVDESTANQGIFLEQPRYRYGGIFKQREEILFISRKEYGPRINEFHSKLVHIFCYEHKAFFCISIFHIRCATICLYST